jgi:hypothetical protein
MVTMGDEVGFHPDGPEAKEFKEYLKGVDSKVKAAFTRECVPCCVSKPTICSACIVVVWVQVQQRVAPLTITRWATSRSSSCRTWR